MNRTTEISKDFQRLQRLAHLFFGKDRSPYPRKRGGNSGEREPLRFVLDFHPFMRLTTQPLNSPIHDPHAFDLNAAFHRLVFADCIPSGGCKVIVSTDGLRSGDFKG